MEPTNCLAACSCRALVDADGLAARPAAPRDRTVREIWGAWAVRWSLRMSLGVLCVASWGAQSAQAQFLERLEAAVRAQLNNGQAAQQSTGELPAPAAEAKPQQTSPAPAGQLPSILEKNENLVPPPAGTQPPPPTPIPATPVPAAAALATPADSEDGIYLGLEAEGVVGGGLGVRVSQVTQGSPAWKAGFEVGDRILAINGFAISQLDDMVEQLAKASVGQTVRFLVSRGGRNIELPTVLMSSQLADRIARRKTAPPEETEPVALGVMVNDLTPAFRQQFGITVYRGAAVTNVTPGSPAARSGIAAGDAIIEANGRSIEKAEDLLILMDRVQTGDVVQLMVARGVAVRPVDVRMEAGRAVRKLPSKLGSKDRATAPANDLPTVAEGAQPTTVPTPREQELEQEVARLRQELQAAQQRLETAESKLQEILGLLNPK